MSLLIAGILSFKLIVPLPVGVNIMAPIGIIIHSILCACMYIIYVRPLQINFLFFIPIWRGLDADYFL